MFTQADARWLSDTVRQLYRAQTVAELSTAAMTALDGRFSLHSFAHEEIGITNAYYRPLLVRCGARPPADSSAYYHDQPFAGRFQGAENPHLLHMRGEVPFSRWSRTDHYNGIARPMGWHDQILVVAQTRPTSVFMGLLRDTVFSPQETTLAGLLQPHIAAAWRRVQVRDDVVPEYCEPRIALTSGLRPLHLSATQTAMLRGYFPRWSGANLPIELRAWVECSLTRLRSLPPPPPLCAFRVESARGQLLIRLFPRESGADLHLVETPPVPDFRCLRSLGLTPRECEVLHWLAQGKRDSEIATLLAVSTATVEKHMEHLLRKFQVENRGAVVTAARARLAGRQ